MLIMRIIYNIWLFWKQKTWNRILKWNKNDFELSIYKTAEIGWIKFIKYDNSIVALQYVTIT
jgi:hypothetical protein